MKTLAEISIEYFWLLMFGGPDTIDPDYADTLQGSILPYLHAMSPEERVAISRAAEELQQHLLAAPDQHGYTPRSRVTETEKGFLKDLVSGRAFTEWR